MSGLKGIDSKPGFAQIYFWIVVIAAVAVFANTRGENFAGLPNIFGDLKSGPFAGVSELWTAALRAAFGLCIFGSSIAVGHLIDRAVSLEPVPEHSHVLELGRKAVIGAIVWLVAVAAAKGLHLDSVGVATTAAIFALPLLVIFVRRARQAGDESRIPERASIFDRIVALVLLAFLGLAFAASITAGTYSAAAMFWLLPVLAISVFGWARESSVSRRMSLLAAVLIVAVPALFYSAHFGFRGVLLMLLGIFAAIASFRTLILRSVRWAALFLIFFAALSAVFWLGI